MFFDLRKIRKIENIVNQSALELLYQNAINAPKEVATVGKIINGKYTTEYNKWCTAEFVDYKKFETELQNAIKLIVPKIEKFYNVKCLNDPEIHFLSYQSGSNYESHIDGQYIEGNIAKRGTDRDITAVLYLNDDYQGGEIFFDFFNLKIKPNKNDLLMYPTTFEYKHSVNKVIGQRYAIVVWFTTDPKINVDIVIPDEILQYLR